MKTKRLYLIILTLVFVLANSAPVGVVQAGEGLSVSPRGTLQARMEVRGRIRCGSVPVQQVTVVVAGNQTQAQADGSFEITGDFTGVPTRVYVAYEANVRVSALPGSPRARLQVFNDFHDTRNESVDRTPAVNGEEVNFGTLSLDGDDCVLWNLGVEALALYYQTIHALPPAGGLRIKRWEAVYMSADAAPHTFYDYIVAPTDLARNSDRRRILFHEFGHAIRHVADGSQTHWDSDNVGYIYARIHDGSQVTNKGFVFNEGWAHYWSGVLGEPNRVDPNAPGSNFLDWNEDLIGEYLTRMSSAIGSGSAGPTFMVRVLTSNSGAIHTLRQFEERYCASPGLSRSNPFCRDGVPVRARPASCPPGYSDDGATCRLRNIVAKPSYGRGAGVPPRNCSPGREYDTGLCYPACPAGYHGVGPVCWQDCPSGYHDDGATCRRDARIVDADNSACPWYDKCGLTLSRGCSVCPSGYHNDGCTCRRDAHIFSKRSQTRGAGTVPNRCSSGQVYDAGLCYEPCRAGYLGVGPVCWGSCPAGFADHGATCYRAPNIFSDD